MRTLVIETATPACSVALIEEAKVVASDHRVVGRGHAEQLLPMIATLPDGGRADRIMVDVGPGSFTGIRVGLAAARALGLGWSADVSGYSSLSLIAAMAITAAPCDRLAVVIEGGHGEVFMQGFATSPNGLVVHDTLVSLPPAAALAALGDRPVVGSGIRFLQPLSPDLAGDHILPDAAAFPLLPTALASLRPAPLYGRAPDAVPAR